MNADLYNYRKANGLCCYCGERAEPGKTRCIGCNQVHQVKKCMRYVELKDKGICVDCGKRKAVRGVRCNECADKARKRAKEYRKIHLNHHRPGHKRVFKA